MKAPRAISLLLCFAAVAAGTRAADADPGEASPPPAAVPAATAPTKGAPAAPAASAAPATTAATSAAKGPTPPPLTPRFQQVRDRIDALFHYRGTTPPPIEARHNPFRPAGAFVPTVVAADGRTTPVTVEQPTSDQALLQDALTTLKIGGVFEIKGRQHRTVNGRPYKEGEVIQTQVQGQPVYLKIKSLGPKSMTLALREAETTVTF